MASTSARRRACRYRQIDKEEDAQKNAPCFVIVVTIIDIALFIWTCAVNGFAVRVVFLLGPVPNEIVSRAVLFVADS
jgi:hypothetical protein